MLPQIRGKVVGSLKAGEISIQVAYGHGMVDGGHISPFPIALVPEECRMPNTYVWMHLQNGALLSIQKMTPKEIESNIME